MEVFSLHLGYFFRNLGIISIIMSALSILAVPLILAIMRDWRFLFIYLIYAPLFLVLSGFFVEPDEEEDDSDDHR